MHFNAQLVIFRMLRGDGRQRLTVAKADLENHRCGAPEDGWPIQRYIALRDAVTGPKMYQ